MKFLDLKELKIPAKVLSIIENATGNFLNLITTYISRLLSNIIQGFTKVPMVMIYIIITILSTYFICTDKFYMVDQLEHHLPRIWVKKIGMKIKKIIASLGNYLKAELILVFISFLIVLIGLYILKFLKFPLEFPLLIAIGIGFVDALPILRFWNSPCALGNSYKYKRKSKLRNSTDNTICNNINNKANNRT